MLSDIERVDVKRHLSIPFSGLAATGMTMGIRTIFEAGQLEFYMSNLQPYEESTLTGRPYGQLRIYGNIAVGQTITATVNGAPVSYTVTIADAASANAVQSVANGLAAAINLQGVALGNIFCGGASVLSNAPAAQLPSFGYVTLVSSTPATFTLTVSGTGGLTAGLSANGSTLPHPNSTWIDQLGVTQTVNGYIGFCNYLQESIATASGNMAMLNAGGPGVAQLRPYEMQQRIQLYDYWRGLMGRVLSVSKDAWGFRGSNGAGASGASA